MSEGSPSQVQALEPHQIRSELLITGLQWWNKSTGRICRHDDQLNKLFPYLQICADNGRDWPPPVLCVGPESDFARLFSGKLMSDMGRTQHVAQDCLGYLQVRQSRQPVIEHIRSRPLNVAGEKIWLSYERLIVPGSLSSKTDVYLVLNKIVRMLREVDGTDEPGASL